MISKKDAAAIAGALSEVLEFNRNRVPVAGDPARTLEAVRRADAVWNACTAVGLEIEALTADRVTVGQFLQWCETGPAKLAEVERQLGGAA